MALQLVSSRTVGKWNVWKEENDKEEKLYMSIEAWMPYETSLESISISLYAICNCNFLAAIYCVVRLVIKKETKPLSYNA